MLRWSEMRGKSLRVHYPKRHLLTGKSMNCITYQRHQNAWLILTSTKKLVSSCHTPFLGLWNDKPHDTPELNTWSSFSCRRLVQAAQLKGKLPFSEKALSFIAWPSTGNSVTYYDKYWFPLSRHQIKIVQEIKKSWWESVRYISSQILKRYCQIYLFSAKSFKVANTKTKSAVITAFSFLLLSSSSLRGRGDTS